VIHIVVYIVIATAAKKQNGPTSCQKKNGPTSQTRLGLPKHRCAEFENGWRKKEILDGSVVIALIILETELQNSKYSTLHGSSPPRYMSSGLGNSGYVCSEDNIAPVFDISKPETYIHILNVLVIASSSVLLTLRNGFVQPLIFIFRHGICLNLNQSLQLVLAERFWKTESEQLFPKVAAIMNLVWLLVYMPKMKLPMMKSLCIP
jgi:hypothetical protein